MGWVHNYLTNDIPGEKSEGFVKPESTDLDRFKSIFDLLLSESYEQVSDSLETHYPSYELVHLTDSSFQDFEYYIIREFDVVKGWGTYVYNPNYQRDAFIAVPHPVFDSNTPYEGVDQFNYLGARFFAMAGTHRCASAEASPADGTTSACSDDDSSEDFKISDMAHNDSTVFQRSHEALFELSEDAWFINLHGHANSSCEDLFISNGRADDTKSTAYTLRDSLLAHGADAAVPGDGSECPLSGGSNTQGRLVNGSSDPNDVVPASNSGHFFHIEQFTAIRKSQDKYRLLIDELGDLIPRTSTSVTFPDYLELSINEIHFFPVDPDGDANGNGSVQTVTDEFVEIVNSGTEVFDLSNWALADNSQIRHTFPSGTKLISGQAIVVTGGSSYNGDYGGAIMQEASTGLLSLTNKKETVIIQASTGAPIFSVSYDTTDTHFTGGSLVRNPDITGDFEYHKSVTEDWFSIGTKHNGDPFVPFATITNVAGWRMLSAPSDDFPLNDLTAFTPVQGIGDENDANLYTSYNGTLWEKPGSLDETQSSGNGFILYFFNNNLSGSSELPITLRASGTPPQTDVDVALHADGDKFNLIGNPFNAPIDVSQLVANGGSLASSVAHIYDPQTGAYVTSTALGDSLAAWQGFMIENSDASSVTFPYGSIINSGKFANGDQLKSIPSNRKVLELSFKVIVDGNVQERDFLYVVLDENAKVGNDPLDARKLYPLRAANKLFSFDRNSVQHAQVSLPASALEEAELDINEIGSHDGEITIGLRSIWGNWDGTLEIVDLLDNSHNELATGDSFSTVGVSSKTKLKSETAINALLSEQGDARFKLFFKNTTTDLDETLDLPQRYLLHQNYPNPFNPSTMIDFEMPESAHVVLEVYNVLGQKVDVIVNKKLTAGSHQVTYQAGNLSSGMYLLRLSTDNFEQTRKMVVLK